jgi:hypothetical protein
MDLVVARHALAFGRKRQRAVEHVLGIFALDGQRAAHDPQAELARRIGQKALHHARASALSRSASLSVSRAPIMQKYSGSTASSAPAAAASASRSCARARLPSRAMAETIWMAATFIAWSPFFAFFRGCACGCCCWLLLQLLQFRAGARHLGDFRVGPGPFDLEFLRRGHRQRLAQRVLRQEGGQADGWIDGGGHQRRGAGIDLGHHHHAQVGGFMPKIGRAVHEHRGVHALHLKVVGAGHALGNGGVSAHEVEGKALAEHVAKIQREAARQRLQAQHAQQLGNARLGLQKLALCHVDVQLAVHAGVVDGEGRTVPVTSPSSWPRPRRSTSCMPKRLSSAPASSMSSLKLMLVRFASLPRTARPVALRSEGGFWCGELQAVQPPLARVAAATVDGLDLRAAQLAAVQLEVVHHDVQRRQRAGLLIEQRFDFLRRCVQSSAATVAP